MFHNRKYFVLCKTLSLGDASFPKSDARLRSMYLFGTARCCVSSSGSGTNNEAIAKLINQNLVMVALLAATALVAGFFAYIYTIKRQTYLLVWTFGWLFYSLHFLAPALWLWIPEGPL